MKKATVEQIKSAFGTYLAKYFARSYPGDGRFCFVFTYDSTAEHFTMLPFTEPRTKKDCKRIAPIVADALLACIRAESHP